MQKIASNGKQNGNTASLDHLRRFFFLFVKDCFSPLSRWSAKIVLGDKGVVFSHLKAFYRYIRISPEKAGQKIKELWEKRGGMSIDKADPHGKLLLAS